METSMAIKNSGAAVWAGDLKTGTGRLSTGSGALDAVSYNARQRFEDVPGTNPEELIAAAHAGCFSMALSGQIEKVGHKAEEITTKATATLEFIDGKPTVTKIHLDVTATVPGASEADFAEAAEAAKAGCPISRLLNAEITMDASLD